MTDRPVVVVPDSLCIGDVTFYIDNVVASTPSPYSLIEQAFKWPGAQWRVDFNLANITDTRTAGQWKAFGTALQGSFGLFLMGDPSAREPVGSAGGSPVVDGGGTAGLTTLNIKNAPANAIGWLRAGDMINLGTGLSSRLYMNMNDVNISSMGKATLNLQPALRNSPIDNAPITIEDAKGVFKMSNNTFSWRVKPGRVWSISFQAEEVVSA